MQCFVSRVDPSYYFVSFIIVGTINRLAIRIVLHSEYDFQRINSVVCPVLPYIQISRPNPIIRFIPFNFSMLLFKFFQHFANIVKHVFVRDKIFVTKWRFPIHRGGVSGLRKMTAVAGSVSEKFLSFLFVHNPQRFPFVHRTFVPGVDQVSGFQQSCINKSFYCVI